ncbi:MAG TPA: peptidase M10 [Anaeromyxobacter sp.]
MRRGPAAHAAATAVAVAAAALAGPAHAYVRTSDPQDGVEVAWPVPVVSYDLSSAPSFLSPGCAATAAGDPVEAAVRASFAEWEQGCTDLRLVYGGRIAEIRTGLGGTAENVVVVRRGFCSQDPVASQAPCMTDPDVDCGGIYDCFEDHGPADRSTVALTTVLYDPRTGRLFDADMEVNGWDGQAAGTALSTQTTGPLHGYYFTCDTQPGRAACTVYGQDGCNGYDLQNTVTHEAGHVIGLAHPCGDPGTPACSSPLPPFETVPYAERTMYPATTMGEISKRTLSADDVAGVCAIYPRTSGGCGCGSGGAPGALAALLALLALRPRLRR